MSICIVNDNVQETVESFTIILENTTDPRIKLDPVNGEIEITDNGV